LRRPQLPGSRQHRPRTDLDALKGGGPMSVMRLGYAHLRVEDLNAAKRHYADTLGMRVTAEGDGRIHLKGWDEFDHHSIVLEEGGTGLAALGYKCQHADDL